MTILSDTLSYKVRIEVWCDWNPAESDLDDIAQSMGVDEAICTKREVVAVADRGTPEGFRRNVKPLAEIRLAQMLPGDQVLGDYVSVAVLNLDKAHIVLNQVRGFVNRALGLIWDSELPDGKIPSDWTVKWQHGFVDPPAGDISSDLPRQLKLLNFMTGDKKAAPIRVRRPTYLMLNALKGIGDFGVHLAKTLGVGFGIVVALFLIEVFEYLTVDLGSTPS